MSRSRTVLQAVAACLVAAALFAPSAGAADKPSHVVIIVLDQARPDTITRYGMENVQELQQDGESFPNAYVGHMAAETVISHNVITSSQLPKHMGWSNEVYRDTDGVLGAAGAYYVTSSMSCLQFKTLIGHGDYPKIQDYLDAKFGESSPFASFTQKRTSACTSGHTSPAADGTGTDPEDIIFQIRGGSAPVSCDGRSGWRQPESGNGTLPAYFVNSSDCTNRWWTYQGTGAYGTAALSPANIYPLDGDRFVPGIPPAGFPAAHVGGDNWSADAAIRFIENEPNWHGMMVSLGGIDKLGHMWGPEDQGEAGAGAGSVEEMRRLPFIAKNADVQVGRIVDALETEGLLDETLIVITADHAAQTGTPGDTFHGLLAPAVTNPQCSDPVRTPPTTPPSNGIRSDCNWYFGAEAAPEIERYLDPSTAVAALGDRLAGNLAFSYQDTQVAAWLKDTSSPKKREAAAAVLDMPDVVASYQINGGQNHYQLYGTNPMTSAERSWFLRHAGELVDTMASSNAPDVVGLTGTNVTYGVIGDHGGANQLVQNIPMVFYGPGVGSADSSREMRLVDVMPTILKTMGIAFNENDLDGQAVKLSKP